MTGTQQPTFTCHTCNKKYPGNQRITFSLTIEIPNRKATTNAATVCGKKCLIEALNRASDSAYGIAILYGRPAEKKPRETTL